MCSPLPHLRNSSAGGRGPGRPRNQRPFLYVPPYLRLNGAAFLRTLCKISEKKQRLLTFDLNSISWCVVTADKQRVTCEVKS
jgi:hypothetical protein